MTHYIAMAGIEGCLTSYCGVHLTYEDAVEDLATLHGLGRKRRKELNKFGFLPLNLDKDGNECCEIIECDCNEPGEHQDYMSIEQFREENPEFYEEENENE